MYSNVLKCYQLDKSDILEADVTDHFPIFTILENVSNNTTLCKYM